MFCIVGKDTSYLEKFNAGYPVEFCKDDKSEDWMNADLRISFCFVCTYYYGGWLKNKPLPKINSEEMAVLTPKKISFVVYRDFLQYIVDKYSFIVSLNYHVYSECALGPYYSLTFPIKYLIGSNTRISIYDVGHFTRGYGGCNPASFGVILYVKKKSSSENFKDFNLEENLIKVSEVASNSFSLNYNTKGEQKTERIKKSKINLKRRRILK